MADWWHDRNTLSTRLQKAGSLRALEREPDAPVYSCLQKWAKRHGLESAAERGKKQVIGAVKPGADITDASAVITGDPLQTQQSPEDLLAEYGMTLDDWVVKNVKVNKWQAMTGEDRGNQRVWLYQITVNVVAKLDPVDLYKPITPRARGWTPKRLKRRQSSGASTWVVFGDPHPPLHEPGLVDALESFMWDHDPAHVICLGDASDNSPFQRHRVIPRTYYDASTTFQSAYDLLSRLRAASASASWELIPGNHDAWIVQRFRELMPHMETLRYPNDDVPALHPRRLLRLDELGIEYVDDGGGEYFDATLTPLPDLVCMHGTKTGKYGGAVTEIDAWEGASVIQGHDHKLGMFVVIKRRADGTEVSHLAISAGTLARRDLGYDPKRNCAQGWVTLRVWPDGTWTPVFAHYNAATGIVTCGDWRYAPS